MIVDVVLSLYPIEKNAQHLLWIIDWLIPRIGRERYNLYRISQTVSSIVASIERVYEQRVAAPARRRRHRGRRRRRRHHHHRESQD